MSGALIGGESAAMQQALQRSTATSEVGQTLKYSPRADVFRFGTNNGHRSRIGMSVRVDGIR
jgi:hypothetical protein